MEPRIRVCVLQSACARRFLQTSTGSSGGVCLPPNSHVCLCTRVPETPSLSSALDLPEKKTPHAPFTILVPWPPPPPPPVRSCRLSFLYTPTVSFNLPPLDPLAPTPEALLTTAVPEKPKQRGISPYPEDNHCSASVWCVHCLVSVHIFGVKLGIKPEAEGGESALATGLYPKSFVHARWFH